MLQNTISEDKFDLICHSKAEKQDTLYGQTYLYKLEYKDVLRVAFNFIFLKNSFKNFSYKCRYFMENLCQNKKSTLIDRTIKHEYINEHKKS